MNESTQHQIIPHSKPLKLHYKKILLRIIGVTVINIALFCVIRYDQQDFREELWIALPYVVFSPVIVGFVAGLIRGAFPYRELSFRTRYLRSSLLFTLAFQFMAMVLMIVLVTMIERK